MLKVEASGENRFLLKGKLDETMDVDKLHQDFVKASGGKKNLFLNLGGVRSGNSSGLFLFIKLLHDLPCTILFEDVPVWMVWQLNMIQELITERIQVKSFEAEYFADSSKQARVFSLTVGQDIPVCEDYSDITLPMKSEGGVQFRPDFDETYLDFLVRQNTYEAVAA